MTNWDFDRDEIIINPDTGARRRVLKRVRHHREPKYFYFLETDSSRGMRDLGLLEEKADIEHDYVSKRDYDEEPGDKPFLGTDVEPEPGPEKRIFEELHGEE